MLLYTKRLLLKVISLQGISLTEWGIILQPGSTGCRALQLGFCEKTWWYHGWKRGGHYAEITTSRKRYPRRKPGPAIHLSRTHPPGKKSSPWKRRVNNRKAAAQRYSSRNPLNVRTGHHYRILQDTKENDPFAAGDWRLKGGTPFLPHPGIERKTAPSLAHRTDPYDKTAAGNSPAAGDRNPEPLSTPCQPVAYHWPVAEAMNYYPHGMDEVRIFRNGLWHRRDGIAMNGSGNAYCDRGDQDRERIIPG